MSSGKLYSLLISLHLFPQYHYDNLFWTQWPPLCIQKFSMTFSLKTFWHFDKMWRKIVWFKWQRFSTSSVNSSPPSATYMPIWLQAITWTNAYLLSIGPLGTNFSENQNTKVYIQENAFENAKWRPCCLGLNVLMAWRQTSSVMTKLKIVYL